MATLVYTSGTTGQPKGCVLTHGNFFAEVDNAVELLHPVFRATTEEPASTLLFLPLSHVFGRMVAVGCLRARVKLGHAPSIATEDLLADLAGFSPTFLLAIPYVLEKVYNTARATAERMGRASSFDRAARIAQRFGEAVEGNPRASDCARPAPCTTRSSTDGSARPWADASVTSSAAAHPWGGGSPPSTPEPASRSSRATG